jgi:hypothetical protein
MADGRVLFTGGDFCEGDGAVAGAGVFDPPTGGFAPVGNMVLARENHTATLLPDGTVLIAGSSIVGGTGSATAELYDPSRGMFTDTAGMNAPRYSHTATLLRSGQVLVAGGISNTTRNPIGAVLLASAEIYTPGALIPAPELVTLSGEPEGQGAVWHATGDVASPNSPASAGEVLSMFTSNLLDGSVIAPQVIVGGLLAEVLYFGPAPGYPASSQVNFRVPNRVTSRDAVPVRLLYLSRPSNQVTISVR